MIPNRIIMTSIFIIIGIFLFSLYVFYVSIHPPRFKTNNHPSKLDLKYEDITFKTSDNIQIKAWFIPSEKSDKTIVICHGYPFDKANVLSFAGFLHPHFNLLFFDFRYFGESQGKYTTVGYKEQKDLIAAVKYLETRKDIDKNKIGALGFSLGGATILMGADKTNIKAIVADSSYATLDNMLKESYKIFPGFVKFPFVATTRLLSKLLINTDISKVSPMESIKKLKTPILIIHGEKDSEIPVENAHQLYQNSNKDSTELWIMPKTDHGQGHVMYTQEYENKIIKFFDEYLG